MCIKHDWFNEGDNEMYEKMFIASHTQPMEAIASMIWVCSSDAEYDEVESELRKIW